MAFLETLPLVRAPAPLPVQLCQAVNESSVACALRELPVQQDRSNRTRSDVRFMIGEVQGSVRACDRGLTYPGDLEEASPRNDVGIRSWCEVEGWFCGPLATSVCAIQGLGEMRKVRYG